MNGPLDTLIDVIAIGGAIVCTVIYFAKLLIAFA